MVIAAHNAAETIGEQLDALCAQDWARPWEIVVVDNGSTDTTAQIVRDRADRCEWLRLVTASDGQGPAYARNVGTAAATGSAIAYCDADDVVVAGWVAAMGEGLRQHEFVSGPVELDELNPAWLAGSRGTTGTEGVAVFEGVFPFASSCNLGLRRARFEQMTGFDEALHVGEDIDLSMRLHLAGVPLAFLAGAVVHYRYRPTLASTFHRGVAYGAAAPALSARWRARSGRSVEPRSWFRPWLWLVRHVPLLVRREGAARWLWVAGQSTGRVLGSLRVRRDGR